MDITLANLGVADMTDLIPRDAAIMAIIKQIGEGTEQWVQGNNSAVYACRASLRAIPTIDPAAIREAALRDAIEKIAKHKADEYSNYGLKVANHIILAMIGEKK